MAQWQRSAECRLCQCPVADTGVRMDQLDLDKLSEWWKQKLDVTLDEEDFAHQWICQFCLYDAKLEHHYTENEEEISVMQCDWWTGFDSNVFFLQKYLQDGLLQKCSVTADFMPAPYSESTKRTFVPRTPTVCIYCKELFPSRTKAYQHAAKDHKDIEVARCKQCLICFYSKAELQIHKRDFHRFLCKYCSRYLKDEMVYKEHIGSMHAHEVIECTLGNCSLSYFKTEADYELHVSRKHDGKWTCIYCKIENNFRFEISLRYHIRTQHKDHFIECAHPKCAKFFKTESEKLEHENDVHASNPDKIECEVCKEKVQIPHINAHMQQFHNRSSIGMNYSRENTKCCYCQLIFPTRAAVVRHVKDSHSDIETFLCINCSLCFENIKLKHEHHQKFHRGNFTCIYCSNWSCTNNSNLSRHIKEKHKDEMIQCKYSKMCALYFISHDDLRKHIAESHESATSKKVQCVYCSKFVSLLATHVNTHHKSVAIRCKVSKTCPTYFLSKQDQEQHALEVHFSGNVVENYKCTCCVKFFTMFYELKEHAQKKHKVTLIKCSFLNCQFFSKSNEMVTQHIHQKHAEAEKLKEFSCEKCNYKCKLLSNLKKHVARLHGTEKLKCTLCWKQQKDTCFKSAHALEYHLKNIHQSKSELVTCIHCKLPVRALALSTHVKQRPCKFCSNIVSCHGLMKKHYLKCKD